MYICKNIYMLAEGVDTEGSMLTGASVYMYTTRFHLCRFASDDHSSVVIEDVLSIIL